MAFTKEFLKGLDLSDEAINQIMAERGKDEEKAKSKLSAVESELQTVKTNLATYESELEGLKSSNATAEDYKAKFEQLQATIEQEKQAAEQAKAQAEKETAISSRYNSVCVDKEGKPIEFTHDAIKTAYMQKFGKALDDKEYEGKSDTDIFHELTKDDATAFKTPQAEVLVGANPMLVGGEKDTDILRKAMGLDTEK